MPLDSPALSTVPLTSPGVEHVPLDAFDNEGVLELQRTITSVPRDKSRRPYDAELGRIISGDFDFRGFLQDILEFGIQHGRSRRMVGLAFSDVSVEGAGVGYHEGATFGSRLAFPANIIKERGRKRHVKHILQGVEGAVRPGQMLLVLGVPGSGCTTLLKTLTCQEGGYTAINGDVSYAGWTKKHVKTFMRGDVVYCGEDDLHLPTLTVKQTLDFAVSSRVPSQQVRKGYAEDYSRSNYMHTVRSVLAIILGLRHVLDTKVGNELIRGISGGQKKRVSIAEVLACRGRIVAFDNSTRGLDASTALEFVKALRISTDVGQSVTMACLYQASDSIVKLFDKITVLYGGRQVFFGTYDEGLIYFHDLGFERRFGQSIGDFLVSVTDKSSRAIRPGFESTIPSTPEEFGALWEESTFGKAVKEDTEAYRQALKMEYDKGAKEFKQNVIADKARRVPKRSSFIITYGRQVAIALKRRYQMFMGDKVTFLTVLMANTFQALITGSVFYSMPYNTTSLFSRGGVCFFALLLNSLSAMTEVAAGYSQRPIVIRQKALGMIHPSADAIANSLLIFPVKCIQVTPLVIIVYFLTDLTRTASAFFIFYGTVLLATYTMVAFFRMLAALFRDQSRATMVAGLAVLDFALYTGYVIPRPSMVVWWKWLSYCNPLAFAFEMLMSNEFRNLNALPCASSMLIPPGANLANQVCAGTGAPPGSDTINGADYLAMAFGYYFSNSGRNAGILFGFMFFFILAYVTASEYQADPLAGGGEMIYKRGTLPKASTSADLESVRKPNNDANENNIPNSANAPGIAGGANGVRGTNGVPGANGEHGVDGARSAEISTEKQIQPQMSASTHLSDPPTKPFIWENVSYEVPVKGGKRRLLNDVSGFVRPGTMTALMGESGAGKTTLLNVLARRTDTGVVTGNFSVGGQALPVSFQAETGYVQQQDTHLPSTTVREALEFSAILRQPRTTPKAEKLAYVDEVIKMLEMESFQDALVGEIGEGLSVEQRKRLSIGVELAARPKLLLFLDEPTSGLSAQASWSIVKFLKKLADAGQAVLCTVHQPSGELFSQFDRLLLLRRGGETVYFGDLGEDCKDMISYFRGFSGRDCLPEENPAEYMLDVIATDTKRHNITWHDLFVESPLNKQLEGDLKALKVLTPISEKAVGSHEPKPRHYASNFGTQLNAMLKRSYAHYWRTPNYVLAKILLNTLAGLFIGSSFWDQGQKIDTAALQNKLFATFMALILSTSLAQQSQPVFLQQRDLFEARERPSKLYSWPVLILTFVLTEIPWNLLGGTLFWVPWYYMVRYGDASKLAAFSWGVMMIFSFYWLTFATCMAAVAPNSVIASTLFAALFSFVLIFCGVTQPPPQMPYFWRSWMPPLSPFTYFIEVSVVLHACSTLLSPSGSRSYAWLAVGSLRTLGFARKHARRAGYPLHPVRAIHPHPPSGISCGTFLANFTSSLLEPPLGVGYYVDQPDGTCGYCTYRTGNQFWLHLNTSTFTYSSSHRYRDIGIMWAFVAFNTILIFGLFWLARIRKGSEGPGLLKRLVQSITSRRHGQAKGSVA
ncbi:hypothetical protein EHS25_006369 [Saitozyma podzolica]|uniref:ABC transporter domain-containing protein n=1 Tax=Saitozyma podzolica TaxID=1890683 RepID=A0A427YRM2_9TREE|nr:hypothetical protein EHS25_006369 [Saitozyma podzolica]